MKTTLRTIALSTLFLSVTAFVAHQFCSSELIGRGESLAGILGRENILQEDVELLI